VLRMGSNLASNSAKPKENCHCPHLFVSLYTFTRTARFLTSAES
jgi:hypothetical protein